MPPHLHWLEDDVWDLLRCFPCLGFAKPAGARRLIAGWLRDVSELEAVFLQYPALKYEPLEPLYLLLKCLGALSPELVEDLCAGRYTWRGLVLAAALAALAPEARYRPSLAAASGGQENQWLVDLALCQIDGREWAADPDFQAALRRLGATLARVPWPATPLRPYPNEAECQRHAQQAQRVKAAYTTGGLAAGLVELRRSAADGPAPMGEKHE